MRELDRIAIVSKIGVAWEQAGVSVNCELCHQTDWSLVAGAETDGAALPLRKGLQVDHGQCFLVYAVQCKNCGNVRVMSKSRIEELSYSDGTTAAA